MSTALTSPVETLPRIGPAPSRAAESLRSALRSGGAEVLRGYGQIVLCGRRRSGLLVLAATMGWPLGGLSGLIAASVAVAVGRRLPGTEVLSAPGLYACNAALTGIALMMHRPGLATLGLAPLAGLVSALLLVAISRVLGRFHLPALSLPFVLSTWAMHAWVPAGTTLPPSVPPPTHVLEVLALLVFTSNAGSGGLLALAVTLHARRQAAVMAVSLPLLSWGIAHLFGSVADGALATLNMELTLVAVGVLFLPGRVTVALSAILAALGLTVVGGLLSKASGLPVLVAPFNVATLAALYVARRPARAAADVAAPPEMAHAVLLGPPFFGQWFVSQGPNGQPTHQGEGRYAWDFVVVDAEGRSHQGLGLRLDDYHAFGIPVRAPFEGTVACAVDGIEDNLPPFENRDDQWGNHVIIAHDSGVFVQVAHLQNGSVQPRVGERVALGQVVGRCGSSGRSLEPHIHVQAQSGGYAGAPSLPAVFLGVSVNEGSPALETGVSPQLGDRVGALH